MQSNVDEERKKKKKLTYSKTDFQEIILVTVISENVMSVINNDLTCT